MASANVLLAYGGSKGVETQFPSRANTNKKSKLRVEHGENTASTASTDEDSIVVLLQQSPLARAVRNKKKPGRKDRNPLARENDAPACQDPKLLREYEEAIRRRDLQRVLWLIANGDVRAEHETRNGENAIIAAVAAKDVEAVRMLVKSGVSIDSSNQKGYTPLMKAIAAAAPFAENAASSAEVAPLSLAHRSRSSAKRRKLPSPITTRHSLSSSDLDTTSFSSTRRTDEEEGSGSSGFDNDIVKLVLELKPDVMKRDVLGKTAFDWARCTGNSEALHFLEVYRAANSLHHAAAFSREQHIAECLALVQRQSEYVAALESDYLNKHSFDERDFVQFLRSTVSELPFDKFSASIADLRAMHVRPSGLDPQLLDNAKAAYFINHETRQGWTPLTKASSNGYLAAVQVLIELDASMHHETRLRHTPLTWASYCGHEAVVLHLLRLGVNVNQQTREGKTALIHAASNAQPKIVHHLLLALREQSYPTKVKDVFDSEVTLLNRRKDMKSAWKRTVASEGPVENRLEWHETFSSLVNCRDQHGKSALQYAEELAACDNHEGGSSAVAAVLLELQHALRDAQEHLQYVEKNEERTRRTKCSSPGCSFIGPKDTIAVHEQHQCLKRIVQCDACAAPIVFETQSEHDRSDCSVRRVACGNLQHGCHERVLYKDLERHMAHHCRKRVLECRLNCGKILVFDDIVAHETTQCSLRTIECELGCPATFLAKESGAHRRKHCPKRLILCTGGDKAKSTSLFRGGDGRGCGASVVADEMAFHLSHLCEKRKLACRWASNGCKEAIGGSPESRYHHEQRECLFRPVSCRNGCELSGSILHCFLSEHYKWQCELEVKPCPHGCEVEGAPLSLPASLMAVHVLEDAGDCVKRLARCPLDLCGKKIVIFGGVHQREISSELSTKDSDTATNTIGRCQTSLRALRQRVDASRCFLDRLLRSTTEPSTSTGANELAVDGWELITRDISKAVLSAWLGVHQKTLEDKLAEAEEDAKRHQVQCRVLTYASADKKYLLEFSNGHSEWISLQRREYDVLLLEPAPGSSSNAADSVRVNPMTVFQCPLLEAGAIETHVECECYLRLVPCPLGCAQRLPSQGVSMHVTKRCNMRNASCRLGCGAVMPFLSLGEHEEHSCKLRTVFCQHCHENIKWQALEKHLDRDCAKLPRRCRLGCSSMVPRADADVHESSQCPKRLVRCSGCAKSIWFCEQRTHEKAKCPLREYGPCDAKCGEVLKYNEVGHHLLFNCTQRVVTCSGCEHRTVFAKLQEHKALLCPQRLVHCRRGCDQLLKEVDAEAHEEGECVKRTVFCSNKCGMYIPCCDLDAHLELACEMRMIECPSGCQEKLFAYQFESHWKRCRQRICPCGTGAKACGRPIRLWFAGRKLVRCASHEENALLWAIKIQDDDLLTYFLQNVDAVSALQEEFTNGFAPLSMAVSVGNVEIVKTLLRFGADVNFETSRGRTALAEACLAQNVELVELLLEQRANVSHTNRQGRNLVAMVRSLATSSSEDSSNGWTEILQQLKGREAIERDQRELFMAIACSDYDFLGQFLRFSMSRRPGTASSRPADQLQLLRDELSEQENIVKQARTEHADTIRAFNESVADAEAKMGRVANLSEQVLDCTNKVARVESHHDASLADSSVLEVDMQKLIREITAQDIAKLLNIHVPPDYLPVMKAICMICGVMPRGRHNAAEYTDMEWWKAAQALLMDRTLLQRLRGYRKNVVTPDVMAKVRRECIRTPGFDASAVSFETLESTAEDTPNSLVERKAMAQLPSVDELRGNFVTLLAVWVKGVEMEYKSHGERQTLVERKRRLAISLSSTRDTLQQAQFDMQVATRSLPARQEEVEAARLNVESEEKELFARQQRLKAFRILTFSALNGHTPLSFAAAIGNEAIVHMLLTHGARAGYAEEEQHLCASFVQLIAREFLQRRKLRRQADASMVKPRSDEAVAALVRNVAFTLLLNTYRRKIAFFRQTHRVALHEAIFNGFPQIVEILLANDAKLWHKTHVLPVRVFPGAIDIDETLSDKSQQLQRSPSTAHQLSSGWRLTPLIASGGPNASSRGPMLSNDTLELAMHLWDCKTFRKGRGWDPEATRYSDTHAFVSAALAKLNDALQQRRREIAARKNVARKAAELKILHIALEAAILERDFGAASELLDRGAYADYETSRNGQSVLMAACVEELYVENRDKRDVLAVEFLLDRPTNRPFVNFESSTGRTALSTAAHHGTLLCAQILLDRGADMNLVSRVHGRTALMDAAANGKTDFVRFLIQQLGINVFAVDRSGKTAFAHAQEHGFDDVMHLLGAAMAGNRGRFFSSVSGLYGVCKWGCGFMANTDDHRVHHSVVLERTRPLDHHERYVCPKRLVQCPLACGSMDLWAERLQVHLASECRLRRVTCAQPKCGASFAHEHLSAHNRDECDFRTIHCSCGEQMTHQKHVVHMQSKCPMRLVACPFACDDVGGDAARTLRFMDLKVHQTTECPNRRVRCRNGCGASDLLFKQRGEHEHRLCSLRRVACKWGCGETVTAHAQQKHEGDECTRRQVACPSKCGAQDVVFEELAKHTASECARRLEPCALGCGRRVPLHVMDRHAASECGKRLVRCERCAQSLAAEDLAAHESAACIQRLSVCGLCGMGDVSFAALSAHRATQCRMRAVECALGCRRVLRAHEQQRHESAECALRSIWCPLGCRATLVAHTLKQHERVCVMRFVTCAGCGDELRERDRARHHELACGEARAKTREDRKRPL